MNEWMNECRLDIGYWILDIGYWIWNEWIGMANGWMNDEQPQFGTIIDDECMYDQWQLEWQMDFSMKIWLKFSWWYTFSFWILDWNGIFLERNFGTTRNKMKWAIWWWWCWRRWILLMMNKWMMNWIFIQWFVNGKNWKAFFNGESFNVCVLQWEKFLNVCVFECVCFWMWLRFIQCVCFQWRIIQWENQWRIIQWGFSMVNWQCVCFAMEIFGWDSFNVCVLNGKINGESFNGDFQWWIRIQWQKL